MVISLLSLIYRSHFGSRFGIQLYICAVALALARCPVCVPNLRVHVFGRRYPSAATGWIRSSKRSCLSTVQLSVLGMPSTWSLRLSVLSRLMRLMLRLRRFSRRQWRLPPMKSARARHWKMPKWRARSFSRLAVLAVLARASLAGLTRTRKTCVLRWRHPWRTPPRSRHHYVPRQVVDATASPAPRCVLCRVPRRTTCPRRWLCAGCAEAVYASQGSRRASFVAEATQSEQKRVPGCSLLA